MVDIHCHVIYGVDDGPCDLEKSREYSGLTLNGSKYLLLELPFDVVPAYTRDLMYELFDYIW